MIVVPTLLLALVPTILIELVVLLLLGERRGLVLGSSVVINMLTNIPLNLFALYIDNSLMTIVLGELLVYQVDLISVVLPHELDYMSVIEGEDYLTLVTCTPYGVNTHRLLVRCKRARLEDLVDTLALADSVEDALDWQGALVCAAPFAAVGFLLMLLIHPRRRYGLTRPTKMR